MSAPSQTYRVTFSSIEHLHIELEATSAEDAIAQAEELWTNANAEETRFRAFAGDCFIEPFADPVQPVPFDGDDNDYCLS